MQKVWQANVTVISEALKQAGVSGQEVAAVGMTGYGNGLVLWTKNLQAVYPAIPPMIVPVVIANNSGNGTEGKIFLIQDNNLLAQPAAVVSNSSDHNPRCCRRQDGFFL